jgi:hypothetical protein
MPRTSITIGVSEQQKKDFLWAISGEFGTMSEAIRVYIRLKIAEKYAKKNGIVKENLDNKPN